MVYRNPDRSAYLLKALKTRYAGRVHHIGSKLFKLDQSLNRLFNVVHALAEAISSCGQDDVVAPSGLNRGSDTLHASLTTAAIPLAASE